MANEAVMVMRLDPAINFTVANSGGIEKGTLLKMSSPMTAALSTAATDVIAGIAASEKITLDGKTKLGVYRRGIFRMYCSGAVNVGKCVTSVATSPNFILEAAVTASGAAIIGHALQTVISGAQALIYVDVGAGSSGIS